MHDGLRAHDVARQRESLQDGFTARLPYAGSPDSRSAGNGALMRLAPIPMFYRNSVAKVLQFSAESTRTTHGAQEAIDCSRLFGLLLRAALMGQPKSVILASAATEAFGPRVSEIANQRYRTKAESEIKGSGYCVESLEAALWCFASTKSYSEAVLSAANLGDDADTTAAICGQLAGAFYGSSGIPNRWLDRLVMRGDISSLADELLSRSADVPAST